ncbi:MAG: MBG domain-containing protein [Clostridia bacterium]|nr:MBG domain-containing protein [Clostridia bacterium]
MKKKLFSVLMSIMLVAVYMPALTFSSYAATNDWSTATAFEDGGYYLISTGTNGTSSYVLKNNNGSINRATLNTARNNNDTTCVWKATKGSTNGTFILSNGGKYLTATGTYSSSKWTYSLSIGTTKTAWKIGSNKLQSDFTSGSKSSTGEIKYNSNTSPYFSMVASGSGTALTFYKYTGTDPLPLDVEYDKTASYDVTEGEDLKITLKNSHGSQYNYTITSKNTSLAKVNGNESQQQSISSNGTKTFTVNALKAGTVTLEAKSSYSTPETCTITLNIKGDVSKHTATVEHFVLPSTELKPATSITAGKTYVIASDTHALKNNNNAVGVGTLTKSGDDVACTDSACYWTATNSSGKFTLKNGSRYLYVSWQGAFSLSTTSSTWTYSNGALTTTTSFGTQTTYYLAYNNNTFTASTNQGSVSLYEVVNNAGTPKLSIDGLTENTDYTVAFTNIDKKGTGTATITGINGYANTTATKTFPVCDLTMHAAVDRDCWTDGNTKYFECSCGAHYYSDAAAKTEVEKDSWVLTKYGHADASHTNAVAAKFGTSGNIEYWYCDRCKNYFDASTCAKTDIIDEEDTVIPAAVALSDFEDLTFDTTDQTPEVLVKDTADNTVAADVVWYKDDVQVDSVKDVGDYTATVTLNQDGYSDSMDVNLTVNQLDLEDANVTVTIDPVTFIHNGLTQKPSVVVMLDDKVISEDDYDLTWEDEESALVGQYNLTVTGKNNCTGSVEKEYSILHDWKQTIEPASFDNAGRIFDACQVEDCDEEQNEETIYQVNRLENLEDVVYTGKDQTPELKVTNTNDEELVEDQDYTIAWYDVTEEETAVDEIKNVGNYKAVITLKGDNYDEESTDEVLFNIIPYTLEEANVVFGEETLYDDGSAKRPTVTVTALDTTLEEGVDYDVICDETKEVGEGYALAVEAKGNFQGSFNTTYDIVHKYVTKIDKATFDAAGEEYLECEYCKDKVHQRDIEQAEISLEQTEFLYNGEEVELNVNTNLTADDYDLVWTFKGENVEKFVEAGEYVGQVTLKGQDYEGTTELQFVINPKNLDDVDFQLTVDPQSAVHNGAAKEPSIEFGTLVRDTDYEITWTDAEGTTVDSPVEAGVYTATATGIGNYTGTRTVQFELVHEYVVPGFVPATFEEDGYHYLQCSECDEISVGETIEKAEIALVDDEVIFNGENQTPAYDTELTEGEDFTVEWKQDDQVVTDFTNAGTYYGTVTLAGYYEGTTELTYTVNPMDLADVEADLVLEDEEIAHDGTEKETAGTIEGLELGTDFTLSYSDNVEVGTATATATGIGNYQGYKSATFEITHDFVELITKASFEADGLVYNHCQYCGYDEDVETIPQATAELDFATAEYTGSVITLPEIVTNLDEEDYDFEWDNDAPTALGTYTATITLKGDRYEGETTLEFEVVKADLAGASAKAEKSSYAETGSAIEPALVVVDANGNTLVKDVDYQVVGFDNNVEVGTASFTIEGLGNYTGTKTGTFFITEATRVEEQVENIEVEDGKLVAKLSDEETDEIIAALDEGGLKTVTVNAISGSEEAVKEATVELTPELVSAVLENGAALEIKTETGSVSVPKEALQSVQKAAGNKPVSFSAKSSSVTKTSGTYDFAFTYVDAKGATKKVTSLGAKATLTIPLPENVKTGSVIYKSSDKTYAYRYSAVAKDNAMTYSTSSLVTAYIMSKTAADAKIGASVQKSTVTTLKATAQKTGKIKLTWKKGKGNTPTGYQVYRSTKKSSGFKKIGYIKYTTKTKTITNTKNLKKGKTYYYKVRGYWKVGTKTYYTKWSVVKSAKCKKTRK